MMCKSSNCYFWCYENQNIQICSEVCFEPPLPLLSVSQHWYQPLADICWESQGLYTFHLAAVQPARPSSALYLKTGNRRLNTELPKQVKAAVITCYITILILSNVKVLKWRTHSDNLLRYILLLTCQKTRKQPQKKSSLKTWICWWMDQVWSLCMWTNRSATSSNPLYMYDLCNVSA